MRRASSPVFTIGHSTHPIAEFIALLGSAGVDLLLDVRSIPRSRTNPQFNLDVLPLSLASAGIEYRHLAALGGRRHAAAGTPPSTNTLWRNAAFRDYADYALSEAFQSGVAELQMLARAHRCSIMCAEAVWWRCHRRIIADYLLASGVAVEHIMPTGKRVAAQLTPGAQPLADGRILYPGPAASSPDRT